MNDYDRYDITHDRCVIGFDRCSVRHDRSETIPHSDISDTCRVKRPHTSLVPRSLGCIIPTVLKHASHLYEDTARCVVHSGSAYNSRRRTTENTCIIQHKHNISKGRPALVCLFKPQTYYIRKRPKRLTRQRNSLLNIYKRLGVDDPSAAEWTIACLLDGEACMTSL